MIRRFPTALLACLASLLLATTATVAPAAAQDAEETPAVKPKASGSKPSAAKPSTSKPAAAKPAAAGTKPAPAAKTATGTAAAKPTAAKPTAAKPAAAAAAGPGGGQPVQLAVSGDWGAYASDTAKGKVCYALAKPKERLPKSLQRGDGYLFISSRPSENVRNEVSVVLGFPTKEGVEGAALIGSTNFALVTKGDAAWVKNAAEDAAFVESLRRGTSLVVKATSKKGNESTDRYALNGLAQALDRVRKECP